MHIQYIVIVYTLTDQLGWLKRGQMYLIKKERKPVETRMQVPAIW